MSQATLIRKEIEKSFAAKCKEKLLDTDPAMFCSICGVQKKEFQNPAGFSVFQNGIRHVCEETEPIRVLDCECERKHRMILDWYRDNLEIYGDEYRTWQSTGRTIGKDDYEKGYKDRHFKFMAKAKSEIDLTNNIMARR